MDSRSYWRSAVPVRHRSGLRELSDLHSVGWTDGDGGTVCRPERQDGGRRHWCWRGSHPGSTVNVRWYDIGFRHIHLKSLTLRVQWKPGTGPSFSIGCPVSRSTLFLKVILGTFFSFL